MKTPYSLLLVALTLLSCNRMEENYVAEQSALYTVSAEIISVPDTRTTLADGGKVLWSEDDKIDIFVDGAISPSLFSLTGGAGTKSASFSGAISGSSYVAIYPDGIATTANGSSISLNLPVQQHYSAASFGSGDNPMFGQGSGGQLSFQNICSLVKLSITGHHTVTDIVFESNNSSVKVSGPATVSVGSGGLPSLSMGPGASNSVTLVTGGVLLDDQTPTDFYLVLPPQKYTGGFTVTVNTPTGSMTKALNSDVTLERSRIHVAGSFAVQLDNGVEPSTSLQGSGSQNNPFLIGSLEDILLFQGAVNAAGGTITPASGSPVTAATAYYRLSGDIDLGPVCGESSGRSWEPIGTPDNQFKGSFDGAGHEIKNLYINADSEGQGFFGYVSGASISNLSVKGVVVNSAKYSALLIGNSQEGKVENCQVYGSVSGKDYTGGIIGNGDHNRSIESCVNYADVAGQKYIGGIVGITYYTINQCVNYGTVSGDQSVGGIGGCADGTWNCSNFGSVSGTSVRVGGVVGNNNAGVLANCHNGGSVKGNSSVGGIAGYARQGSSLWNNVNRGNVTGTETVGGICGYLSSNSSYQKRTNMQNCVNLGVVSSTSGAAGGLCGKNEGQTSINTTLYDASEAKQNYWLYDESASLGTSIGFGSDEGLSSNNFSLNNAQMKGAQYGVPIYGNYDVIVDALNSFAYENVSHFLQAKLSGWKADELDGYPTLTGAAPDQQPGGGNQQEQFAITPTSVELEADGGTFTVTVTCSTTYHINSKPDWVTEVSVSGKVHTFSVPANPDAQQRSGVIVFCDDQGTCLPCTVKQKAGESTSLEVSPTSLSFDADAGTRTFNITSNQSWTVTSNQSWCQVSPSSGSNNGMVTVSASANGSSDARNATITVTVPGKSLTKTISVSQAGAASQESFDWSQTFYHRSLMMRFTATWCGWCPRMNRSVHLAQEQNPGKIEALNLHGGGSDLDFSGTNALMSQYGINGFPTGILDGRRLVENYDTEYTASLIGQYMRETEQNYPVSSAMSYTSSWSGQNLSVDVSLYLRYAANYKVTVVLLEDGIINQQSDNEEGYHNAYTHDRIARMALTSISGDAFSTSQNETIKHFNYSVTVPSSYNKSNLKILVYVQREFGSQTVLQSGSYGSYYVDNCASGVAGGSLAPTVAGQASGGNEGITPGGDINMQ